MKTKPTQKNVLCYAFFYVLLFGMSYSGFSQCPTVTNPTPPPICDANGYTFNDLNAFATDVGSGIVWYDMPVGGNSFNPNELVTEGVYYAGDNTGTCGTRAPLTVDFVLGASSQNLDRIYCSNENATLQTYIDDVLQSIIPIGGSVEIYNDIDLISLASSTDIISLGGSEYFIVFVDDNTGCKGQLEFAQLGVFNAPADPTPANPQAFCSDTNPTIGDLDPGTAATNFSWYANVDGSGNPILPALSMLTPLVDGNSYYIQISDAFCESNAIEVLVNIDVPVNPGTPGNLEYCDDSLPVVLVFDLFDELGGPKNTNGTWSGPLTTTNGNRGTVNISTLTTAGTYTFTYTVPSNGVCPDGISNVTITVYETFTSGTALSPASFCEASLPSAFDLFTLLENQDPDGQWTDGSNNVIGNLINLTGSAPNTYNYTYTQNLLPNPCPEESTTVEVIVLQDPDAGTALNDIFCVNALVTNSPYNLFDALDGSQDHNSGTWTDSANTTISNSIDITGFTVAGSPYLFNYTIDNGTCSDTEQISITIEPAPESGTAVATFPEFCEGSASASFELFDLLDGEDQTGTWYSGTDNTGTVVSNPIDLSGLTTGTYDFTFDVDAIGSCDEALVTVQITINPLPITGTPTPETFCENDLAANSPLDLFGQLTGEDAGGTWTDDNTSGALSGSDVDLTLLTIGTYNFTYTITDSNSCTNSSTVTIIVEDAPESGTPVATFPEFCEGSASASFELFDLLDGEDQTGTWYSGTDNTGTVVSNPIDLSGLTAGTYDFTFDVDAIGSCDEALVTVQITINPLPITGTPTPETFCENDLAANSPLDLFGQLTGEDAGGTWTDDNTSGALSGSDVDLTLLTIGTYNFTYTITDSNSCTNNSTVTIIVEDAPESGTANTPIEFCVSNITAAQTYNLFDLLTDEDQTGTWNDDDSSGALSGNLVTLDGLSPATYNFTYDVDAIGTCDDVNITVSIIINDTPAPASVTPQEFCDTATVADLVATGTTIQWYDAITGGNLLTDGTALADAQIYYATQTDATTGCESSARTAVTAIIYLSPNAGAVNTTAIVSCNDNNSIDLFTGLDGSEDAGGTWQNDDGVGSLTGNVFDATGVTAGTYNFTYLVTASAPCVDDNETISITIEAPLNAGSNVNPTLDMCSNEGTTDLFTLLGGADTGGVWSPAMTRTTGVFDPLVDPDGTYTYTLTNSCGTFTNQVAVTVTLAPNAGTDNTLAICAGDDPIDLFTLLGTVAQSGGVWSPALTSTTGVFDPAVDTSGTYIYTVTAVAPCSPDSTAEISVTVSDTPAVIILDPDPEFCLANNPTVTDLSISIRPTGTVNWYDDIALTIPLLATDSLVDGEDYYATQTNSTGCESSIPVQINVTVNDIPTPTLDDATIEYCINDNPTISTLSLNITERNSSLDNLRWYDTATGGSAISSSSPLTNITYYVVLVDPITTCESSMRLEVIPDLTACGKLEIPDGFSPNGDRVNDTFDVDNLVILYPNFVMEIYNRNGNIVYKGNANTPRFDGTSNQSRIISKGALPVGVYFYIFNFNDGENKPEQGRLYLSR